MNHYPRHIGDYLRDTGHLSLLEHGAYSRLLDLYYLNNGPLQLTVDDLIRKLSARAQDEREAVERVLREFFAHCNGVWSHKRADKELEKYQSLSEQQRARVSKRWSKNTDGIPTVSENIPTVSENIPQVYQSPYTDTGIPTKNQEPRTKNHKPRTKLKSTPLNPPAGEINYPAGFDTVEFKSVFTEFQQHRVEIKKPMTPTALRNALLRAEDLGLEKAIPALRAAMAAGYSQFYEQQEKSKINHDHRSEKRSREFIETIEVPDLV